MGGAYAMGAPWQHFTRHCNPQWSRDLGDWLAKMTGHAGPRGSQPFGQWGMFAGAPFGPPWWGEQVALALLSDAGFGPVEVHDAPGDPGNAIFVTHRPR